MLKNNENTFFVTDISEEFDVFTEVNWPTLGALVGWQNQYKWIITVGKMITPKPYIREESFRLYGCELPTWLAANVQDGRLYFIFDSDSRVINGLAALVFGAIQGETIARVKGYDAAESLQRLGITRHLTPSRNNGLMAIIERVKMIIQHAE